MNQENERTTYASTGVNYEIMDPFKRLAQLAGQSTAGNLERFGFKELESSRGESAYVWDEGDAYRAFVVEGLGTKNLVADTYLKLAHQFKIANETSLFDPTRTYYDHIARCTIAMIVNDMIVVGADPMVIGAYFAVGSSDWFKNEPRVTDAVNGWTYGCNEAGAVWAGGETPTLKGVIEPDTIDLAGASVGIIKPKTRLTLGDKLAPGDSILLAESSGIHANGLTLARTIADKLPESYATLLSDGKTYGESLLEPTHIYVKMVRDLFEAGIDIHYMVNITGHGWRKLMRAEKDLTYVIDKIPEPQTVFQFIQEHSGNDDQEMYGNFNMGSGFAVYVPENQTERAQEVISLNGKKSIKAGSVEEGPKRVVIRPKGDLTFTNLGVR